MDIDQANAHRASDADLVDAVVKNAAQASRGEAVSPAVTSLLRAIASTRSEKQRAVLAQQAAERVSNLTSTALQLIRVAIFALA